STAPSRSTIPCARNVRARCRTPGSVPEGGGRSPRFDGASTITRRGGRVHPAKSAFPTRSVQCASSVIVTLLPDQTRIEPFHEVEHQLECRLIPPGHVRR